MAGDFSLNARVLHVDIVISGNGKLGVNVVLGEEAIAIYRDGDGEIESRVGRIRLRADGRDGNTVFKGNIEASLYVGGSNELEVTAGDATHERLGLNLEHLVTRRVVSSRGKSTLAHVKERSGSDSTVVLHVLLGDKFGVIVEELGVRSAVAVAVTMRATRSGSGAAAVVQVAEGARNEESDAVAKNPGLEGEATEPAVRFVRHLGAENLAVLTLSSAEHLWLTRAGSGAREEAVTPSVRLEDVVRTACVVAAPDLVTPPDAVLVVS